MKGDMVERFRVIVMCTIMIRMMVDGFMDV